MTSIVVAVLTGLIMLLSRWLRVRHARTVLLMTSANPVASVRASDRDARGLLDFAGLVVLTWLLLALAATSLPAFTVLAVTLAVPVPTVAAA